MKEGVKFELLAAEIFSMLSESNEYESVSHDVMLDGVDGPRQIDVLLTGTVGPFNVKTIIECKDYAKNVNVTAIDALHSKLIDVRAEKAVMVARKGFTKGARRKAERLGIELCTIHSAKHEKWKFKLEIPIIITEHYVDYSMSMRFTAITNTIQVDQLLEVNGISVNAIVAEYWERNEIYCNHGVTEHEFHPDLKKPNWIHVPGGQRMEISDLCITLHITRTYYFGYANNIKSAKYINFVESNKMKFVMNAEDLSDYRGTMQHYKKVDDIPIQQCETIFPVTVNILHFKKAA